jgi:hypothetical protein
MEHNYLDIVKGDNDNNKNHLKAIYKNLSKQLELEIIPIDDEIDKNQYYNAESDSVTNNYYYTFHDEKDSNKNELNPLYLNKNNNLINLFDTGFRLVDTNDGAIMMKNDNPIFILVKRNDAIEHNNNGRADYETLEWIMKHHCNIKSRGTERSGFSENYFTIGAHGSHFERGIHIKKLIGKGVEIHEPHLKKWFGRVKKWQLNTCQGAYYHH